MGIFGKKSRGPVNPLSQYAEEAVKYYWLWLLPHYETQAEIMLDAADGWELQDTDQRDPAFPRANRIAQRSARSAAIGHRAAFTDLRDRRYKHLIVAADDRPFVTAEFISGLEPQCIAKLQHDHPSLNMDLVRYYTSAPHYRKYTWQQLGAKP